MTSPWREPAEETTGLYPGLVVHDGRMAGAVTVGRTRLPLYAVLSTYLECGWEEVAACWPEYDDLTEHDVLVFLHNLLELRGEFARLLLVLADAERCEAQRGGYPAPAWWETKRHRQRVAAQLRSCLAVFDDEARP